MGVGAPAPRPGRLARALRATLAWVLAGAGGCVGAPAPPPELVRVAPDRTIALDLFGTFTPSVSRGCGVVSVTSNHQVYAFDRRRKRFVRVSASPGGEPATHSSHGGLLPGGGRVSEDGTRVAFTSMADNLVSGGPRLLDQVYVRDLPSGRVWRASRSSTGAVADRAARWARLSGDGRVVAFVSAAANLVPGDTNGMEDVFVHELDSGATTRVSTARDGGDADGPSFAPSLSRDGRLVAFASDASDLVAGDTNGVSDVFVHDRVAGWTRRVSLTPGGAQASGASDAPALGADGRFVAFSSEAPDLVPGDANGLRDVFVHDRRTRATARASVAHDGAEADGSSDLAAISEDGTRVAFVSVASNLVPGDTNRRRDVFLRDRARGVTLLLSRPRDGGVANEESGAFGVALSSDGTCAAFDSYASNLVPDDYDQRVDVFLRRVP